MGQINDLAKDIYANETAHGFNEDYNLSQKLLLVVSEISEAVEADRTGKWSYHGEEFLNAMYSSLDNPKNIFKADFEANIKDSFEDEISDAIIRLLGISAHFGIDIEKHIQLKHEYNKSRPFKHGKKY